MNEARQEVASSRGAEDCRPIEEVMGWEWVVREFRPDGGIHIQNAWKLPNGQTRLNGKFTVDDLLAWLAAQKLNAYIRSELGTPFVQCEITDHRGDDWGVFDGATAVEALSEAVREVDSDA